MAESAESGPPPRHTLARGRGVSVQGRECALELHGCSLQGGQLELTTRRILLDEAVDAAALVHALLHRARNALPLADALGRHSS